MSEPQQYILNQSVTIEPGPSEDSVNVWLGNVCLNFPSHLASSVFVPVDIPSIEKQLEGHLASFIVNVTEYVDLCDHAQNAEELNAIRGHFNRCQHEHIAQVLRLFGLENKETEQ